MRAQPEDAAADSSSMRTLEEPPEYLDQLARDAIGAAIEVHRELGPGFLESIYEAALCDELTRRDIQHERQPTIPIPYKGRIIGEHRLDILVGGELVLELKAVESLSQAHVAQVMSYLHAGAFRLGLLINFSVPILRQGIKRLICPG